MKSRALAAAAVLAGSVTVVLAGAPIQFVDVSAARGIQPYETAFGFGAGVAAADFDGDGDVDLFVPNEEGHPDQLYRNLGNGVFEEIAVAAGVASLVRSRVALWFDYDGDQLLDLFVARDCWSRNAACLSVPTLTLYRQVADAQFQDVTTAAGLDYTVALSVQRAGVAAGDINNDGYLDLAIGLWSDPAQLFLNNGNGTFTEIGADSGVGVPRAYHQPVMYDMNGDGLLDIFWAIDFTKNLMWLNQGGNTFADGAPAAALDNAWNDMGVAFGDYDNDDDFDIFVTNITENGRHNALFRNDSAGSLQFVEEAQPLGIDEGYWGWGTTWIDADNDGWLDLAATNGYFGMPWETDPSKFYLSSGSAPVAFTDLSDASGFNDDLWGSALIAADLDRDGDLDLVQACNGSASQPAALRVLDNQQGAGAMANNYLVVRPRMTGTNHLAIGAVVRIEVGSTAMMRLITAGTSYLGQEPAEAFFGVGAATLVDRVTVDWPWGGQTELTDVAVNQMLPVNVDVDTDNDGSPDAVDADDDNDGVLDAADCFATNAQLQQEPGGATNLRLSHTPGTTTLTWSAPADPGGSVVYHDTISSPSAADFRLPGVLCEDEQPGDDGDGHHLRPARLDPLLPRAHREQLRHRRGRNDLGRRFPRRRGVPLVFLPGVGSADLLHSRLTARIYPREKPCPTA